MPWLAVWLIRVLVALPPILLAADQLVDHLRR
jgi:hypothetical protein